MKKILRFITLCLFSFSVFPFTNTLADESAFGRVFVRMNAVELNSTSGIDSSGISKLQAILFATTMLIFVAMLASEIVIARRRRLQVYSFSETVSNLTIYYGQQAVNFSTVTFLASIYDGIQSRFGYFDFSPTNPLHWVSVILMADLTYYFTHRSMHRVNLFLIPHSVHHQARDYNHISSFRLPWIQRVFMFPFYSMLAFIGVPTTMLVGAMILHLLCGIIAHSGVIRRNLGILEYVFVTPRSHYVHHGMNPEYLDRNFGGIFVFWDRLFGTFAEYDSKILVVLPAERTLDPIESNFDYFRKTFFAMRKQKSFFDKLAIVFGTPELVSAVLEKHGYRAYSPARTWIHPGDRLRILGLLTVTIIATTALLVFGASGGRKPRLLVVAIVLVCSLFIGRLLERKTPSPKVNLSRETSARIISRTGRRPLKSPSRLSRPAA